MSSLVLRTRTRTAKEAVGVLYKCTASNLGILQSTQKNVLWNMQLRWCAGLGIDRAAV